MFWDGRRNLKNQLVLLHEGLFETGYRIDHSSQKPRSLTEKGYRN